MINDRKLFESRGAFWTLICLVAILFALSIFTNLMSKPAADKSAVSYTKNETIQQGYNEDAPEIDQSSPAAENKGYKYQVIVEDGTVNVYSLNNQGEKSFFCETEILYELLSENDKKMMTEGIIVNSMEELNSLLQDFES